MFSGYGIGYARVVNAQVHDSPGEPADQAAKKKGVRALFEKVNKTKALNNWLEDTALGELIGTGEKRDSAARPSVRQHRRGRRLPAFPAGHPAGEARDLHGRAAPSRPARGRARGEGRNNRGQHRHIGTRRSWHRERRPIAGRSSPAEAHPPAATPAAAKPPAGPAPPVPAPAGTGAGTGTDGDGEPADDDAQAGTEPGGPWPSLRKRPAVPASTAAEAAGEVDVTSTQPIPAATDGPASGNGPAGPHHPLAGQGRAGRRPLTGAPLPGAPLISRRPQVNPRLRSDPRLRVWIVRVIVMLVLFAGFTIWRDWRYGVTAAIIYAVADLVYRSKTTAPVPPAARVTSAQRYTRRRLKVLQPAGYLALHARKIPGTSHVIDHVVVGPAGVFTLDSQRLDRRLPLRAIGGMLYHGRTSMEGRVDHAKDESRQAGKLIADELGKRVRVKPVMVMYGPSTSWVIMAVKGVDVFDGSRIGTYFRRQTKLTAQYKLTSGQIAMVYAAAARALPPVN